MLCLQESHKTGSSRLFEAAGEMGWSADGMTRGNGCAIFSKYRIEPIKMCVSYPRTCRLIIH